MNRNYPHLTNYARRSIKKYNYSLMTFVLGGNLWMKEMRNYVSLTPENPSKIPFNIHTAALAWSCLRWMNNPSLELAVLSAVESSLLPPTTYTTENWSRNQPKFTSLRDSMGRKTKKKYIKLSTTTTHRNTKMQKKMKKPGSMIIVCWCYKKTWEMNMVG